MEHEPLPECIDRLARIETNITNIVDNDLFHLREDLRNIRNDIKELAKKIDSAQKYFMAQLFGVFIAMIGLLIKSLFF